MTHFILEGGMFATEDSVDADGYNTNISVMKRGR